MKMRTRQYFKQYKKDEREIHVFRFCPMCGKRLAYKFIEERKRLCCLSCDFVFYHNPCPGAVALIVKGNKILLGKRSDKSVCGGKWGIPGGFMEWDEHFIETAHREVFEETGLKIRMESIINVVSNFLTPQYHTLVVVFLAHVISGKLCPSDDLTEVRWFFLDEKMPPLAFKSDRYIIEKYRKDQPHGLGIDERFLESL